MSKEKKIKVIHVDTRKKIVCVLWVILVVSVCFGVYKNFTAVDQHTVHEEKIIEQQLLDTNSIENFVVNFARVYYSWENNKTALDNRTNAIKMYLTEELQNMNIDTVRQDVPTCAAVVNVMIWNIQPGKENEYKVTYTVIQNIKEGENAKQIQSCYDVVVYMDEQKNMVIVKNPTLSYIPEKSSYVPKVVQSDNSLDAATVDSAVEFLRTFFKMYPTASKEEIVYYVKDEMLHPVTGDYIFSELVNPVFIKDGEDVMCYVAVKFLDNQTKSTQVSQYVLRLHKNDNWMIIGVE